MKSTTNIWIALRNIGDSQDQGDSFNGTLSESILWMAGQLAKISMAGRIVVGMGRTQKDALRGIDVRNAGKTAIGDDMKTMLDGVFADIDESTPLTDSEHSVGVVPVPGEFIAGDDYVA